jgi:addiction module HigA family antidote
MTTMHEPLHPGEIVRDALFNETELHTVGEAAERLKVQRTTLSRLLNGHTGISVEMAYKLSLLLDTSCEMWLNIQRDYDLWKIRKKCKRLHIQKLAAAIHSTAST